MSSFTYLLTGDDPHTVVGEVEALGATVLARDLINGELNRLISDRDGSGLFNGADEGQAHVPYAGWYWRSVDFFADHGVTIANEGGSTVVCENNKWGYDERSLSDEERGEFLRLVWAAHQAGRGGGNLAEIHASMDRALDLAGVYIASLDVAANAEVAS